jgi:hypothetical protein
VSSLNTGLSRLRRLLPSQKTGAHAYRIEARFDLDFERRRSLLTIENATIFYPAVNSPQANNRTFGEGQ